MRNTAKTLRIAGISALLHLISAQLAMAQTDCARRHTETGVYICYPTSADPNESFIYDGVHFSAQGNAPDGKTIGHFKVLVDGHLNYESWATPPAQNLSIETNLNLPLDSGEHVLQLVMDGVGSTELKGLKVKQPAGMSFCDPFFRADARTCAPSKRPPLKWSLDGSPPSAGSLDEYSSLVELYTQNFKALEADVADAAAIDAKGDVYVASHVFSDVELRKYAPSGAIVYDLLIRSCSSGFLSVPALAVDNAGRAWIAANTTACFQATSGAFHNVGDRGMQMRGWVILVDTTKSGGPGPVFITSLSDAPYQIAGIRVNEDGDVYLAGTTDSLEYPHDPILSAPGSSQPPPGTTLGFVSLLNSSGSALKWSALLRNALPTALAIDNQGSVYITGRSSGGARPIATGHKQTVSPSATSNCESAGKAVTGCGDLLIAEITDHGQQLPYVARIGGSGSQEGRAISLSPRGDWVVVQGDTDSPDFPVSGGVKRSPAKFEQSVVMALQPCKVGLFDGRIISAAGSVASLTFGSALDALASMFAQRSGQVEGTGMVQTPLAWTPIAPACPLDK